MQILRARKDRKSSRLGQQVVEYAVLLAAISMALTVMYVYAKRGLQSTIKDVTDKEIGSQVDSEQVMAPDELQKSNAVVTTVTTGAARIVKNSGEASYFFDSSVASAGVSNTVSNQLHI